jgi:putative alpha-1,2-mannosidase
VPKNPDGSWVKIDLKHNWGSWQKYFYEGNSWTYSLFVPHQFDKLVEHLEEKKLLLTDLIMV